MSIPIGDLLRRHPLAVLLALGISIISNSSFYILAYIPTYGRKTVHLPASTGFTATLVGGLILAIGCPFRWSGAAGRDLAHRADRRSVVAELLPDLHGAAQPHRAGRDPVAPSSRDPSHIGAHNRVAPHAPQTPSPSMGEGGEGVKSSARQVDRNEEVPRYRRTRAHSRLAARHDRGREADMANVALASDRGTSSAANCRSAATLPILFATRRG